MQLKPDQLNVEDPVQERLEVPNHLAKKQRADAAVSNNSTLIDSFCQWRAEGGSKQGDAPGIQRRGNRKSEITKI